MSDVFDIEPVLLDATKITIIQKSKGAKYQRYSRQTLFLVFVTFAKSTAAVASRAGQTVARQNRTDEREQHWNKAGFVNDKKDDSGKRVKQNIGNRPQNFADVCRRRLD